MAVINLTVYDGPVVLPQLADCRELSNANVGDMPVFDGQKWVPTPWTSPGPAIVALRDTVTGLYYSLFTLSGTLSVQQLTSGTTTEAIIIVDSVTSTVYKLIIENGILGTEELLAGSEQNTALVDGTTGVRYKLIIENGIIGTEEL